MKNKKTSIAGYLTLASAIAAFAAKLMSGTLTGEDVMVLSSTAAAGAGLLGASDGGH